jgi:ElaB/YqjD/DUF883 family membrane-anchored ribosome-binding protein
MAPESFENVIEAADTQARQAMRMAQDFTRDARETIEEWTADVRGFVRAYPLQILAATIAVGYVLGKLTRR